MKRLTVKQAAWVEETIETLNPTEAVRRVYKVKSNNVAKSISHENLTKPYLREALEERMREIGPDNKLVAIALKRNIQHTNLLFLFDTIIYFELENTSFASS